MLQNTERFSAVLRQSCAVFAVCMGKQFKGDSAIVDLGRANHYRLAVPFRSRRGVLYAE